MALAGPTPAGLSRPTCGAHTIRTGTTSYRLTSRWIHPPRWDQIGPSPRGQIKPSNSLKGWYDIAFVLLRNDHGGVAAAATLVADAVTAIDEFYSAVTTKPGENRLSKWQNPAVARVSGGVAASEWVAGSNSGGVTASTRPITK